MTNLSVIIAVNGGQENLTAIRHGLSKRDPSIEIIYCVAGGAPAPLVTPGEDRVLECAEESLTPHLWRDGIRAAKGQAVALTTAQFMPTPEWLAAAGRVDLDHWAGVGGPIDNDGQANPVRWAVFLLRYMAFAPPRAAGEVLEIAADNAVYRRDEILRHDDLLERGFWEPSFHARFRAAGLGLFLDPSLILVHRGHDTVNDFCRRRFQHGREYGRDRARGGGVGAFGLLLRSPLTPFVLLLRIARRTLERPRYLGPLLFSMPWLVLFCAAWSLGEARGYLDASLEPRR